MDSPANTTPPSEGAAGGSIPGLEIDGGYRRNDVDGSYRPAQGLADLMTEIAEGELVSAIMQVRAALAGISEAMAELKEALEKLEKPFKATPNA